MQNAEERTGGARRVFVPGFFILVKGGDHQRLGPQKQALYLKFNFSFFLFFFFCTKSIRSLLSAPLVNSPSPAHSEFSYSRIGREYGEFSVHLICYDGNMKCYVLRTICIFLEMISCSNVLSGWMRLLFKCIRWYSRLLYYSFIIYIIYSFLPFLLYN